MNILDLLDDILAEIVSRCAIEGIEMIREVRLVVSRFRWICDRKVVLTRLSLEEVPFYPWGGNNPLFTNFYERLREVGNPEALYTLGIQSYFIHNHRKEGMRLLAQAFPNCLPDARFLYGIILVFLGKNSKIEGYNILIGFFMSSISQTLERFHGLRQRMINQPATLGWRGYAQLRELKCSYVREACECKAAYILFLRHNEWWQNFDVESDMPMSYACELCICHDHIEHILPIN